MTARAMLPKPRVIGLPAQRGARIEHDPSGRPPLASVSSVRLIPRPCSCTWRLNLGAAEATWSLTEADPFCPMHAIGDEEGAS